MYHFELNEIYAIQHTIDFIDRKIRICLIQLKNDTTKNKRVVIEKYGCIGYSKSSRRLYIRILW